MGVANNVSADELLSLSVDSILSDVGTPSLPLVAPLVAPVVDSIVALAVYDEDGIDDDTVLVGGVCIASYALKLLTLELGCDVCCACLNAGENGLLILIFGCTVVVGLPCLIIADDVITGCDP